MAMMMGSKCWADLAEEDEVAVQDAPWCQASHADVFGNQQGGIKQGGFLGGAMAAQDLRWLDDEDEQGSFFTDGGPLSVHMGGDDDDDEDEYPWSARSRFSNVRSDRSLACESSPVMKAFCSADFMERDDDDDRYESDVNSFGDTSEATASTTAEAFMDKHFIDQVPYQSDLQYTGLNQVFCDQGSGTGFSTGFSNSETTSTSGEASHDSDCVDQFHAYQPPFPYKDFNQAQPDGADPELPVDRLRAPPAAATFGPPVHLSRLPAPAPATDCVRRLTVTMGGAPCVEINPFGSNAPQFHQKLNGSDSQYKVFGNDSVLGKSQTYALSIQQQDARHSQPTARQPPPPPPLPPCLPAAIAPAPAVAAVRTAALGPAAEGGEVEEVLEAIPRDERGQLTSVGSVFHQKGLCRPCLFFKTPIGCQKGLACKFCHIWHKAGDPRRPCKAKRDRYRNLVARVLATGA